MLAALDFNRTRRLSDRLSRPRVDKVSISTVLEKLGLIGQAHLVLDIGDSQSYPGSGDVWFDRSIGRYDFDFGDGSTGTTFPTFNGSPGGLSAGEYLSLDGGDFLTLGQSNPAWVNALHQDSALFTIIIWVYTHSSGISNSLIGTEGASTSNSGISLLYNITSARLEFRQRNSSGTTGRVIAPVQGVTANEWQMFALSLHEAANTSLISRNLTFNTQASSYTAPDAGPASHTLQINAVGNNQGPPGNSHRTAAVAVFGVALSQAQITAIFNATRGRFGV